EPPFGAVTCGGLTGHAAVSGGAVGHALPGTGAPVPPAATSHPLRGTSTPAPGTMPAPGLTGAPAVQAAPNHRLADTGADPARRTAPFGDSPDPGAAPQNRSLPVTGVRAGGVNIPYGGAEYSGDAWAWVRAGERVTLMLADGLGHGPEAARASSAAVAALYRWAHLSPAESLGRLHDALKGTRGAAVAMAQLDLTAGRLRFAGIGNVGARLRTGGTWRHLLSRPGIVGVHRPTTLREEEADWTDDPLLILHTDGLPSRWTPPSGPGLLAADPAVTAAVTIRDTSSPARPVRDDTAVAVLTSTPPERP
ncbi:SpoIIE family protein phosphatase, partial [Streptomyces sp. SID7499]|nr:SpoIIE family protein phosphatase [Streptomyces sp. SID7499]